MKKNNSTFIIAISTILAAIVAGLFSIYSDKPQNSTKGNCSSIITGNINGNYDSDCK